MDPHRLKGVHCYNNDKILETLHDIAMKMDIVKERVTMIKKLEKKVSFIDIHDVYPVHTFCQRNCLDFSWLLLENFGTNTFYHVYFNFSQEQLN